MDCASWIVLAVSLAHDMSAFQAASGGDQQGLFSYTMTNRHARIYKRTAVGAKHWSVRCRRSSGWPVKTAGLPTAIRHRFGAMVQRIRAVPIPDQCAGMVSCLL
jgi:hypothetical protein